MNTKSERPLAQRSRMDRADVYWWHHRADQRPVATELCECPAIRFSRLLGPKPVASNRGN
jgi:hypothetical protein